MIEKELCALTKQLMLTCMGGRNLDKIQEITGFFTNNAVVIGSRSDEFYTSVEQIENALNNDKWKEGRNYICRPVKEWFQCIPLSEEAFLVCGNIRLEMIFGSGDAGEAAQDCRAGLSEADVRVSAVWKLEKEQIHALHIHFSLPEEDFLPCRAEDLTGTAADEYHGSADRKEAAYYKKLSERDLMTGLYNRGSFEKYVKLQLNEVGGGTFYMIDLDDFKAVNDTYGHVAGDRVIAGMAGILREVFGESAVIGRLGGDEFAVFENGSNSRKESEEKARRVMQAYRLMSEKYGNEILLSCSIGLYREKGKETFENLYSCADEALYFSKNSYKGTFHWYYRQCRT